tara:strand:+ start:1380 stop:2324 length:945 start_codon:yes stop_codon:yes gene_type:complete
MRLLVNCDKLKLLSKKDITVLIQIEEIIKYHKNTIYVGNGWKHTSLLDTCIQYLPDIILFAADFDYNDIDNSANINIPKIAMYQDFWHDIEKRMYLLEKNNIFGIITKNIIPDEYLQYYKLPYKINHSGYDENIFQPINYNKDIDILISGKLCPHLYPQRTRFSNIINNLKHDFNIVIREHPSYFYDELDEKTEQIEYNKMLNRSKFALAGTALTHRLHMQKIWEISATSAICITDVNDTEPNSNLISKHTLPINPHTSDIDVENTIRRYMSTYDKNMYMYNNEIVKSYASLKYRTIDLINHLKWFTNNALTSK